MATSPMQQSPAPEELPPAEQHRAADRKSMATSPIALPSPPAAPPTNRSDFTPGRTPIVEHSPPSGGSGCGYPDSGLRSGEGRAMPDFDDDDLQGDTEPPVAEEEEPAPAPPPPPPPPPAVEHEVAKRPPKERTGGTRKPRTTRKTSLDKIGRLPEVRCALLRAASHSMRVARCVTLDASHSMHAASLPYPPIHPIHRPLIGNSPQL